MDVLLLGASGRIGQRITTELLDRGHSVAGVSRSGDFEGHPGDDFVAVAGDATNSGDIARLAADHDAVASALGPSGDESADVLPKMLDAVVEGMRRASVERLVWTGGAGILNVGPNTRLIDSDDFPEEWKPVASAAIDAYERLEDADDLRWTYLAPAALIEPGERTGDYRTAVGELVADDDGESYISMEDFAVAFVDELESSEGVHEKLGVGY
ncbi:NAD(P)-dependent oxidoreductase [Haloferax namakaokahaiae]|uniref:NAD(P)-dependent oxidoreductase n=1 Tax=Haloferax namakaokahaiae TaxID=1748331 RepID=A0ABD5ZIK5_9EURY